MTGKKITLIVVFICFGAVLLAQNKEASLILEKSIQYHDPKGQWNAFHHQVEFLSQRPNGTDRKSIVTIDNNKGYFSLKEPANDMEITLDQCSIVPEGKTCAQVQRMRNYYIYLWGLPMKLKDDGTVLSKEVGEELFNGIECFVIRVPYEQDVWIFYIDKKSYALKGYLFYKDEPTKKGEVIYLDEEVVIDKMRIPKRRKWYTTPDKTFLGTDILISTD